MKYFGYFISPYGDVIPLTQERHIQEIIANPEKFGLTSKEIIDIHKKNKEKVGGEGNSREIIIANLIKDGWSRVRYITRDDSFTVQIFKLDKRTQENIYDWANLIIKKDDVSKYTGVTLMEIKPGGDMKSGTLDDIVHYKLFEESARKRLPTKAMIFIENYIVRKK